jgi:hypothetical protein
VFTAAAQAEAEVVHLEALAARELSGGLHQGLGEEGL